MAKSVTEWMHEGEEIYSATMKEYRDLESELDELEKRLLAKKEEVNQLAQVISKPPVENQRRVAAQLLEERSANIASNPPVTIARALAGRTLNR